MSFISKLVGSCCIRADQAPSSSEKGPTNTDGYVPYQDNPSKDELVEEIIAKLFAAEKNDAVLQADLQSTIHTYGWYDGLAAAILAALEKAIKQGEEMGPAVKAAYEKSVAAVNEVQEWAEAHPVMAGVIITIIAFGVLALMTPWLMAYLGFAEEGIVEGSLAARWQATYNGFVPKNSLFSYLQRLGTKIGRKARPDTCVPE